MTVVELIVALKNLDDQLAPVYDRDDQEIQAIHYNEAIGVVEIA